jgi:ribosome-associated translation inhibitor RaiA
MELKIIIRGVENGASLRELAEKKFTAGLNRYSKAIRAATVRLTDETGPRKHKDDKRCAVELDVRGGPIRINEVTSDFAASIAKALDRARAALSRSVSKSKRGVAEG